MLNIATYDDIVRATQRPVRHTSGPCAHGNYIGFTAHASRYTPREMADFLVTVTHELSLRTCTAHAILSAMTFSPPRARSLLFDVVKFDEQSMPRMTRA